MSEWIIITSATILLYLAAFIGAGKIGSK